jgi:uncharacterized protein (DUF1330 family)
MSKIPRGLRNTAVRPGPSWKNTVESLVMMSQSIEVGDGSWSPIGIIMFEFESMAKAQEWYNSPEYSAVKPMRLRTADTGVIFADVP